MSLRSVFENRPFDTKAHDRQNTLFDVRCSMLNVRCSMFISFLSDLTGRSRPEATLNPEPRTLNLIYP
jgi:hypothetical protein